MKLKAMLKQQSEVEASAVITDTSVDALLDGGLLALSREMKNLLIASAKGKLDSASARDLRDSIKLLFELKERESKNAGQLDDEQLKEQAKAILNGSDQ